MKSKYHSTEDIDHNRVELGDLVLFIHHYPSRRNTELMRGKVKKIADKFIYIQPYVHGQLSEKWITTVYKQQILKIM